jgi:dihydroxy-acid dehydratase
MGVKGMRRGLTRYGDEGFALYLRKAFIKALGYSEEALARPVVGIADTSSGYNACHATVPQIVEAVKRGVLMAGGLPVAFPTISLHESFAWPTSMYLRNLMAMDTEEMIRAQPMDAAVLIGGCDKTVPAQLMAAASAGERLGACTDCRRLWARFRAGDLDEAEVEAAGARLVPTAGTCGVMGTASTMACLTEALGMMLPGGAAIPAVEAERLRHAEAAGARAVALAEDGPRPSEILTPQAFANALAVLQALGGSTNALIHLAAVAGRLGIAIDYEAFDRLGRETPLLVDLKPSGRHYMDELQRAGGLAPVLRALAPRLALDCLTVTGRTLGEEIEALPPAWEQTVVRPLDRPLHAGGALAMLGGNLAGEGAVIKQSACSEALLRHSGRAVVFDSLEDLARRVDAPDLAVEAADVLVLRNAGPKGAPGMPEAGYLPIPRKLAERGVTDMVRISDARMSGTAFGTIVLHASPEAAVGGPLALVRDGDTISLDVPGRRLTLEVPEAELARRRAAWRPPVTGEGLTGYRRLYHETVLQASRGCDFDFLAPPPTERTP